MNSSGKGFRRRLRGAGGRILRRVGALPEGVPDGLGQDAELRGTHLSQRVIVYYSETRTNLYQLRQWYEPLRALNEVHPVMIMLADSKVAQVVAREAGLPHIVVARSATIEDLVANGDLAMFLYVGHHQGNFTAMRITTAAHVYLSHGESDKRVSVSNQIKAYDFAFVAGQGAIDRIADNVMLYDGKSHLVPIGRPQLDSLPAGPPARPTSGTDAAGDTLITVLYAPTWEGGQGSGAYSSVVSHGKEIVRRLIDDGRFRVLYRPHPRTGVSSEAFAAGDAKIRAIIDVANDEDPTAHHRVDTAPGPRAVFEEAEVLVADISAMPMDWLASSRPLIITRPDSPTAVAAATRLLDTVPRLAVAELPEVAELVHREATQDPLRDVRAELIAYYFGDTTPGASTARFVAACTEVIATRDAAVAAMGSAAQPDAVHDSAVPQ